MPRSRYRKKSRRPPDTNVRVFRFDMGELGAVRSSMAHSWFKSAVANTEMVHCSTMHKLFQPGYRGRQSRLG